MKKCPNCNVCYSEEEYQCCHKCGVILVPDYEHFGVKIGDANTISGIYYSGEESRDDSEDDVVVAAQQEHANVMMGDANAISGGVHSSDDHTKVNSDIQVHTNSHNTTNNTTIYQAPKSNSEKFEEDKLSYRLKCKDLFVNGFISKEDEKQLRELQVRLGLTEEHAKPIREEVRQQSIKRIEPTASVRNGIHQTKFIIEQNNDASLQRQLKQLESWMGEYDDDTLKFMYYQLSAMLEPAQFTSRYEKSAKNEYWEVYWAHIAYILRHNESQANIAHSSLGRLQGVYGYPEQNDVILHLAGRLMQNDLIVDIQKERNSLTANYSRELQLLLAAIDELLQMDWTKESITIRPTHSFYVNTLFANFVETQKKTGEEQRRKKEDISRAERERQNEIKRQKAFFLQKYCKVQDREKVCDELGLSELIVCEWLKDDPDFTSLYNRVVDDVERRKAEEAARIRREQEHETEIQNRKDRFKSLYEQNDCDLLKTCFELGVDSYTVGEWRKFDKVFDDALATIERDNERRLQNTFANLYVSNNCNLQKTCADMGIGIDVVDNWRKVNNAVDNELSFLEKEYEHALQEAFAKCYESYGCDIRKTCDELGIKSDTVNEWRRSNKVFDDELNALKKEYERMMQDAFVDCYKSNDCDLPKSCEDMRISSDVVRVWRETNKIFDNAIKNCNRIRFIRRFKKKLPYVLIACFLIAGGYGYHLNKEKEREKLEYAIKTYDTEFDECISLISNDAATDEDIHNLRKAANVVKQMRSEGLVLHIEDKITRIEDIMRSLLPMLDKAEDLAKDIGDEQEIKRIEYLKNIINDIKNDIGICND